eukprot:Platyproteum_vivax@DN6819_c0_g1_i1.p1
MVVEQALTSGGGNEAAPPPARSTLVETRRNQDYTHSERKFTFLLYQEYAEKTSCEREVAPLTMDNELDKQSPRVPVSPFSVHQRTRHSAVIAFNGLTEQELSLLKNQYPAPSEAKESPKSKETTERALLNDIPDALQPNLLVTDTMELIEMPDKKQYLEVTIPHSPQALMLYASVEIISILSYPDPFYTLLLVFAIDETEPAGQKNTPLPFGFIKAMVVNKIRAILIANLVSHLEQGNFHKDVATCSLPLTSAYEVHALPLDIGTKIRSSLLAKNGKHIYQKEVTHRWDVETDENGVGNNLVRKTGGDPSECEKKIERALKTSMNIFI